MNTPNIDTQDAGAQGRPAWLPAKFWDEHAGQVRTEALARSYQELESRMGDSNGNGDSNGRGGAVLDLPDRPDAYDIVIDDDLLDIDEEVNQRLFENGFSQTQAQLVYDLAKERLMPMVAQISAQYENTREESNLHEHFGGAERFEAIRPQLRAWGEANLTPTVFENLTSSAQGVIAMFEMMKNREPGLMHATDKSAGASEQDLKRMMKDPRYWKERDPGAVARVRQGFRALYPEG